MRSTPALGAVILLSLVAQSARADCPMTAGDEQARGFLAEVATQVMPASQPGAEAASSLELAAAISARSDPERPGSSPVSAALGGEGQVGSGGWRACAAGDLAVERTASASLAAGVLVPLLTSGIGVGATFDYQRELALSARPQWLSARLTEARAHLSLAFIDLPLASGDATARLQVTPVWLELIAGRGEASAESSVRVAFETAMLRFAVSDPSGDGVFELVAVEGEHGAAADAAALMPGAEGTWVNLSLLRVVVDRGVWRYLLSGGMTAASSGECGDDACLKASYAGELGWRSGALEAGLRAARSPFFLGGGGIGIEDRLATELSHRGDHHLARGEFFVATTESLGGDELGRTGGVAALLALPFGRGFEASLRGQLARSFYADFDELGRPLLGRALQLSAALSWRTGFSAEPR